MDTSASLLQRVRERRDEEGWQRLVQLYTPLIHGWLGRHLAQPDDISDLVRQVFAAVVARLPSFVPNGRPGAFRRWLRSITINQMRAFWRSRQSPEMQAEIEAVLDQLEDPASDLSRQWDREHDEHVAHKVLGYVEPEFKPAAWRAFCRLVLDDERPEAVAAELDLSVNAVFIAKSHVLRRLREEVQGLLD